MDKYISQRPALYTYFNPWPVSFYWRTGILVIRSKWLIRLFWKRWDVPENCMAHWKLWAMWMKRGKRMQQTIIPKTAKERAELARRIHNEKMAKVKRVATVPVVKPEPAAPSTPVDAVVVCGDEGLRDYSDPVKDSDNISQCIC